MSVCLISNSARISNESWAYDWQTGLPILFQLLCKKETTKHSTILWHFLDFDIDLMQDRPVEKLAGFIISCCFLSCASKSIDRFNYIRYTFCWPFAYTLCAFFLNFAECFLRVQPWHISRVEIRRTTDFYWNFIGFRCFSHVIDSILPLNAYGVFLLSISLPLHIRILATNWPQRWPINFVRSLFQSPESCEEY